MTFADTFNGSPVIGYVVCGIIILISVILLSGHGAGFIAGYNNLKPEEKEKYDEKKLCKSFGACLLFIGLLCTLSIYLAASLPASFSYVMLGIILVTIVVMIVIGNFFCRKWLIVEKKNQNIIQYLRF